MPQRGGRRPRRFIRREDAPVWVPSGRWGPRRARVEHCVTIRAERVYHQALCAGEPLKPGDQLTLIWRPQDSAAWESRAELVSNAVWRHGRLFLRCLACARRATRLYVPIAGLEPRCRRCWGLTYECRSWSYKASVWVAFLGPVAYATTDERRRERRKASQQRYAERRSLRCEA